MSHYTLIHTEVRREHMDCLLKALTEIDTRTGKTWPWDAIQIHAKPVQLEGYQGDRREQRAHIVIPRKYVGPAANDIGIEWRDGLAVLHVSEYDAATYYGAEWQGRLAQRYAVNVAKKMAPVGYQVEERTEADGTVVLEMRRA